MKIRPAQPADYPAILQLQSQNTPANLSTEQRKQGFIVSQMDEKQLDAINQDLGILVAIDDVQVAAFVCLARTHQQPRPPVVDAMLEAISQHQFQGKPLKELRVFLYGPVCIDSRWRGKGVLSQLVTAVKAHTCKDFDVGAAFVNHDNQHSLAAHVKGLNMTPICEFTCQQQHYQLLVFTTTA
ncbi:GNAT family N-acetyltransferase [Yersinia rochesterensis]|uniref:N-acetyltransferase n=1 Tax=Yersinia rochesterensis TaxID=1604335 RepID=A0A8D4N546_9GAMM|nr:N-acetyltransferase [Yersinia rochesterensis]AYD44410.1 N-acetyltransferase [Yersinia rochesterensis]